MKINSDLLQIEVNYVKPIEINMVEVTDELDMEVEVEVGENIEEKMKVVYPITEEKLIDFLNRYKLKHSEVMLCPRSISIFDKKKLLSVIT